MNKSLLSLLLVSSSLAAKPYVYLDVEGLYLLRCGSSRRQLATYGYGADATSAITSQNLIRSMSYEPCLRVAIGANNGAHGGFFRGLVAKGWSGNYNVTGTDDLYFPFNQIIEGYSVAQEVKSHYTNNLTVIEGYITRDLTPLWKQYFAFRGLMGLQYFNVPENVTLTFYRKLLGATRPNINNYTASSNNNLGLASLGIMIQIRPYPVLAMEFLGLGGIGASFIQAQTKCLIDNDKKVLKESNNQAVTAGYSFMSTLRAVYRPVNWFQIGVGYELIYATGLCLAYKKMTKGVGYGSDGAIPLNGGVSYQGASLRIGFSL
jgi:hypothetical protein